MKAIVVAAALVVSMLVVAPAALPADPTVINVGMHAGSLSVPFYLYGPDFEEEWNVKLNVVEIPYENYYTKMLIELATESGAFDVIWGPATYLGDFGPYLMPMDDYVHLADPMLDDVIPAFREGVSMFGGNFYGGIYDGDVLVYFYRNDLFTDADNMSAYKKLYGKDLAPATTWEEYRDIAKFFTESVTGIDVNNSGKIGDFWGVTEEYRRDRSYTFWGMKYFGYQDPSIRGMYFDPDTMEPLINKEAGVKAEELRIELLKYAPPGNLGWFYPECAAAFLGGDVAQEVSWPGLGIQAMDPDQSNVIGNVWVAEMPGGATILSGTSIIGVVATTQIPELAYRLATYMTGPEVTLAASLNPKTGVDPSRYSHLKPGVMEPDFVYGQVEANIEIAYPELMIPGTGRMNEILGTHTMRAESGEITAQEAMDTIAAEWSKLIDRMGKERMKAEYRKSVAWYLK